MSEKTADKIHSEKTAATGVSRNLGFLIWSGAASVANSVLLWIFFARWRSAEEL